MTLLQNNGMWEYLDTKMIINSQANETHLQKKGFVTKACFHGESFWNSKIKH